MILSEVLSSWRKQELFCINNDLHVHVHVDLHLLLKCFRPFIWYLSLILRNISSKITCKGCISPRIVFSNRPDLDQIVPDDAIFLIGTIAVMNRLQSSPFLTRLSPDQWTMAGGDESRTFLSRSTRFRGASMRKYAWDKGTFMGHSDDQDDHGPTVFDRLLFFNMFKNSSRSLFRYPTLGGLRRSRQIFPRRYRVVRDSARRFPTIFAKMRPIDQKRIGYYRDQNNPWWNGRLRHFYIQIIPSVCTHP